MGFLSPSRIGALIAANYQSRVAEISFGVCFVCRNIEMNSIVLLIVSLVSG